MAANLLEKGSPEFVEVFETAVRIYRDDPVANLNAAIAALQNGNTASAKRYLEKVTSMQESYQGAYFNAMGALSWLKGDADEAEGYIERAEAAGSAEAAANLREMRKIKSR